MTFLAEIETLRDLDADLDRFTTLLQGFADKLELDYRHSVRTISLCAVTRMPRPIVGELGLNSVVLCCRKI